MKDLLCSPRLSDNRASHIVKDFITQPSQQKPEMKRSLYQMDMWVWLFPVKWTLIRLTGNPRSFKRMICSETIPAWTERKKNKWKIKKRPWVSLNSSGRNKTEKSTQLEECTTFHKKQKDDSNSGIKSPISSTNSQEEYRPILET